MYHVGHVNKRWCQCSLRRAGRDDAGEHERSANCYADWDVGETGCIPSEGSF